MRTPLRDAVQAYAASGRARFHMPGHKGRGPALDRSMDITEVEGCDSLYEASGPILELEREAARLYGAGASLLSAGGATLCIQTMLAMCGTGAKIIAGRGLHRSALNAMVLLDQEPVWVYPACAGWFRGVYQPEEIGAALEQNQDAAAVYITSPDYFGVMSDLAAIAKVCQAYGKPLLVDNAHGAHLKFCGGFHPMDCGAEMCSDSLHKTLPALTGGALLHLADSAREGEARRAMAMFGSTSPSYPIMLSCEEALCWAAEQGRTAFTETSTQFAKLEELASAYGFLLPPTPSDPAKLAVGFAPLGLEDAAFGGYLRGAGVEPEYIGGGICVLMGNSFNSKRDFEHLRQVLENTPQEPKERALPPCPIPHLQKVLSLREAAFSTCVEVSVESSAGRVAARESSPCPPGIPVVMCGEHIDCAAAAYLAQCGMHRIWVVA